MPCCPHCIDAEDFFTERAARRELKRYRKKGPTGTTQLLLRMLREEDLGNEVLLDVGGGIGAIQHELLRDDLGRAVHVDASRAYLRASEQEAARQGHRGRVDYRYGDFADLADELPEADLVTLDRVVCCYPDMPRLVRASAAKARRLYGLSFPRAHAGVRAGLALANLWFALRGSRFRAYLYPPAAIAAEVEAQGFRRVAAARTLLWCVELYRRARAGG